MKCEACGIEFADRINPNGLQPATMCFLCEHLLYSGLPFKYLAANESNYDQSMQKWFRAKGGLFIHGAVGTGKTWLMSALMRNAAAASEKSYGYERNSLFISFPEMAMRIRSSMNAKTSETEASIIKKYGEIPYLFLDDIGAEKSSEYMQSVMFMLMEKRNTGRNRRTVITSNLSLNMLAQQHGERVASRIAEMCEIIKLSGTDRRLAKRSEA
jgi:DNA replication protein DnaC